MQSNNPILTRAEVHAHSGEVMTVQGAVQKSLLLSAIAAVVGISFFVMCYSTSNYGLAQVGAMVGAIGAFVLALVTMFKPNTAPTLAVPYALFEGVFLGGLSLIFEAKFPGIASQALLATFTTAAGLFGLYRMGIIRATEKFKAVVLSATIAIAAIFLIQMLMSLLFSSSIPGLFEPSLLGIGFAAFVAVIASLNLILDFDLIENGAQMGAPKSFEWLCSIALLATLVWMYVSFLRLIGLVRSD